MAIDVKVPAVGESIVEGMIGKWHKNNGEFVNKDDVLLELETDKATVDIVAEGSGTLEILAQQGKVVKVGEVIARMQEGAGASAPQKVDPAPEPSARPTQSADKNGPAVSRMAKEQGMDLSKVQGTGRDGRVTKKDLLAPQGEPQAPSVSVAKDTSSPTLSQGLREEIRKPMSMLRRRIAERLIHSQNSTATLTTFNEVDMTEVMALRDRYKDAFLDKHGVKLGFMSFFVKASIAALKACPEVNAYIDGTDILYHNYCDVGVAVSTEKGLMVPIIRNADQMSLAQLEKAIADFAVKARQNKITIDDLAGGTFTVSNGGVFGSLLSTPILNPPQTAIMGMHKTQMRPMVMPDGSIKARPMMYLAMSYDHRILDGKEAVTFLVKIKEGIEDPSRLLLEV